MLQTTQQKGEARSERVLYQEAPKLCGELSQTKKNLNTDELPKIMLLDGQAVNNEDLAEAFANYFESKVNSLISNANITKDTYKLKCKNLFLQ